MLKSLFPRIVLYAVFILFSTGALAQTITVSSLNTHRYCVGDTLAVSFTTSGTFNQGNQFTVWLSDSTGSFNVPYYIGADTASPIKIKFASSIPTGDDFRVKVVSNDPYIISNDNGADFSISSLKLLQVVSISANNCNLTRQGFKISNNTNTKVSTLNWAIDGPVCNPTRANGTVQNVTFPFIFSDYFQSGSFSITFTTDDSSLCPLHGSVNRSIVNCQLAGEVVPFVDDTALRFCDVGSDYGISFVSVGTPDINNIYTAYLSDASGSFAAPTVIGTLKSAENFGSIQVTIPSFIYPSSQYKIGVSSSTYENLLFGCQSVIIDNASIISINIIPHDSVFCHGINAAFTAESFNCGPHPTYQWKVNGIAVGGNSSFTSSTLEDGDVILCEMTSDLSCGTQTIVKDSLIVSLLPSCPAHFTMAPDTNIQYLWYAILDTPLCTVGAAYQWNWGDNSSSVGTTPEHGYSAAGRYNICLSIANNYGCVDTYCDSANIYRTDGTPITVKVIVEGQAPTNTTENISDNNIKVYPNPSSEKVILSSNEKINEVVIKNAIGQVLYCIRVEPENSVRVKLPTTPGLYFLDIKSEHGKYVRKIIKE